MEEVDRAIAQKLSWTELPDSVRQVLGHSRELWVEKVRGYCWEHCIAWSDSLLRSSMKENEYYEVLITHQRANLRLYPYHIAGRVIASTKLTNFHFYITMLEMLVKQERSYDALPNFTARDCTRLTGIGRNEFIDIMNRCRGKGWLWNKKSSYIREELPKCPNLEIPESWWIVMPALPPPADTSRGRPQLELTPAETEALGVVHSPSPPRAGDLDAAALNTLFIQGLIRYVIPVQPADYFHRFIMNRSVQDSFEQLLYRIFVSVDTNISVGSLAELLEEDVERIQDAISLYCRLGFAQRAESGRERSRVLSGEALLLSDAGGGGSTNDRAALVVDRTIAALLMMGNLSAEIKPHAVTLYEVGKLAAKDMDLFLKELEKVTRKSSEEMAEDGLGAMEYFHQAESLYDTLAFLTTHKQVDMLRSESLKTLDRSTCQRLLESSYSVLLSISPTDESLPVENSLTLPHYGFPSGHFHSPWFRLFTYAECKRGPKTLLLPKGTCLMTLPAELPEVPYYTLTTLGGWDSSEVSREQLLLAMNRMLRHSPVMIQPSRESAQFVNVALPFTEGVEADLTDSQKKTVQSVIECLGLGNSIGSLRLAIDGSQTLPDSLELGVPLKDRRLNRCALEAIGRLDLLSIASIHRHTACMADLQDRLKRFIADHSQANALWEQLTSARASTETKPPNHTADRGGGVREPKASVDLVVASGQRVIRSSLFEDESGSQIVDEEDSGEVDVLDTSVQVESQLPVDDPRTRAFSNPNLDSVSLDRTHVPYPCTPLFFDGLQLHVLHESL